MNNIVYMISGPLGVGKTTAAKLLRSKLDRATLIHGDQIMALVEQGYEFTWEEKISITWKNILALTRNFIRHDIDVVIDFVVETELKWFCDNVKDLHADIKYAVLRANAETLIERLEQRGDSYVIDRSLFLLKSLQADASNQNYIIDTTIKQPGEVVEDIQRLPYYYVS